MAGLPDFLYPQTEPRIFPTRTETAWRGAKKHRTLFLSDMHLGARTSQPDLILQFLAENEADTIYLVGDIADNWHPLARNWTGAHHNVVRHILSLPQTGTRVIYIPGNHDAFFRKYAGTAFNGIEVRLEAEHRAADGQRYLVIHGDSADVFAQKFPFLARLGNLIETAAYRIDGLQRHILTRWRQSDWTGVVDLIDATNAMIRKRDHFEERLTKRASHLGYDGIICGHFHQAALHSDHGIVYANCGDWVGSNTALAEGLDGRMTLMTLSRTADASAQDSTLGRPGGELTLST
jgi:UDP-2,3-diacylglucosamine pyrophosphatase LpxH